jgi:hypothetical protein
MPKASKAEQVALITAWRKAHPDKVARYNATCNANHEAEYRRIKREWWRAHKGTYGSWDQYVRTMKQTGGIGYSSSTGYQNRPKGGRPGPVRKRGGANTEGAWTGNPDETV